MRTIARTPEPNRGGFALPVMLMVVIALTVTLGAGFMLSSAEHSAGADHDAQLQAYTVAQEGLETYLTTVTTLPTTFPDQRTFNTGDGQADVTMRLVKDGATNADKVFLITSAGKATAPGLSLASTTPLGARTVSQFVGWSTGSLTAPAAFTSLATVNTDNGNPGLKFDGNDACGVSPPIGGLAVPDGGYDPNGGNNATINISGNPEDAPVELGTPGTGGTAKDNIDIDWAGILAGDIAADILVTRSQDLNHLGSSDFDSWPVMKVVGNITNSYNLSLVQNGRGILIVTGDALFSNFYWKGIVLVGGRAEMSGTQANVEGAVLAGLNVLLGTPIPSATVANGLIHVTYNSCHIEDALENLGGWRRLQNTWSDNWPEN